MDIASHLDSIKVANFNAKLNCELDYLKNIAILSPFENGQDISIEERISQLEIILKQPGIHQNSVQQQKDNMFNEIDKHITAHVYKKQWNKLKPFHKMEKLKEYLNENIKEKSIADKLLADFEPHVNKGSINTKKYIIYDPNEEKILSLPCLKIIKTDKEDNDYKVDIV